ncbi:MAG TPA: host attachment protein [Solirubrobacteraceae bacterium]|nr:host attachment protein [Solirubrobacteraceae bacterium]
MGRSPQRTPCSTSTFAAVALPASVETTAVLDTVPWLEPLAGILTWGDWGVALLGRGSARLFRGSPTALVEFATVRDELYRSPLLGDHSRDDASCLIEEHVADHVQRVAEMLLRAHRRRAFKHLAVAAPHQLWPTIENALHSELRSRLAGLVALDLQDAPAREVSHALVALMEQTEHDHLPRRATVTATAPRSAGRPIVHASSTLRHPVLA